MFNFTVIGNLGGDAELHNESGTQFLTFRVGHTERHTDSAGNQTESTIWVSCVLNGDGGKLLQYLKKGQKVCVIGDGSLRTYHSKKMQRLIAGANLFVRQIELLGAKPDGVPSALFDEDGVQVNITKYYYAANKKSCTLFNRSGEPYQVDANGWVIPPVASTQTGSDTEQATAVATTNTNSDSDAPFDGQGYETVEDHQIEEQKKTNKAKK